ncbi:hypothetical protein ACRV5I_20320 [Bacillus halotolerans]|uniref:hypothetical protein n=1 Tax=Bacillus halotolerans TaxID=260554 RepID=UPI003EBE17D4
MTQKVQLTTKQAKAMDSIKNELEFRNKQDTVFKDISTVINYKINGYGFTQDRVEADSISDVDFILALTVGYEVKQTAEEVVEDIIRKSMNDEILPIGSYLEVNSYSNGIRRAFTELEKAGIQFTLKDE